MEGGVKEEGREEREKERKEDGRGGMTVGFSLPQSKFY